MLGLSHIFFKTILKSLTIKSLKSFVLLLKTDGYSEIISRLFKFNISLYLMILKLDSCFFQSFLNWLFVQLLIKS